MRKLRLLKNLEMGGKLYPEGSEVELEDHVYDYIVKSYLEERRIQMEELARKEEEIKSSTRKGKK